MSYLPELRESLMRAAERHGERLTSAVAPERSAGRPRRVRVALGRLGAGVAVAVALLVAVLTVLLVGHRRGPLQAPAARQPAASEHALHVAAQRTLGQLRLPPGARPVSGDESAAHRLGSPGERLGLRHVAYAHAYWYLPESPQTVVSFLEARHFSQVNVLAANRSTATGPVKAVRSFTITFPLSLGRLIATEVSVSGAPRQGGGTAIREQGEAGGLVPRPFSERIPSGITRVLVVPVHLPHRAFPAPATRTHLISSPSAVGRIVAILNQLPLLQSGTQALCRDPSGAAIRLSFLQGASVGAQATLHLSCASIDLAIGARPQPPLALELPIAFNPSRALRLMGLLERR